MSKNVIFFLPILAILLAGCSNQPAPNQLEDNGNSTGGNAGVIDTNQTDNSAAGDQTQSNNNPANDAGQSTSSPLPNQPITPPSPASINNQNSNMPTMIIDKNKTYTAILHTGAGDIEIALNSNETPITVNNFVWLAKKNFYNSTIFHRVINGFMIQGGDPKGDGTGDPGYKFNDEPFTGEYTRGTVAMANAGPNTNGSQFFIMQADYPLPHSYIIFGQVIKGLDVVDKIATAPVQMSPSGEQSQPVAPVKVNSIDIIAK